MQYYTFTSWQQVEDWIKNNGLVRWDFAAKKDEDKSSQFVSRSEWYAGDMANKLDQTRRALESQPGRYLYGAGWVNENRTGGDASCEVMISAGVQGVGGFPFVLGQQMQMQQPQQIGAAEREDMRRQIRDEIRAEMDREQYKRDREQLDKERKEFEAEKQGVLGLAVGYLAPVAEAIKKRMNLPKVAGVEATQPIIAAPIQPVAGDPEEQHDQEEQPDPEEESPFTDAEADQLFALMARFKAVEPDYMKLLAAVVEMAEKGDATYTMAKGFLMK